MLHSLAATPWQQFEDDAKDVTDILNKYRKQKEHLNDEQLFFIKRVAKLHTKVNSPLQELFQKCELGF